MNDKSDSNSGDWSRGNTSLEHEAVKMKNFTIDGCPVGANVVRAHARCACEGGRSSH